MDMLVDILCDARVATVIIGTFILLFIYKYSTRNHDYWKKRGLPYAEPYPFVGSLWENFQKNLEVIEHDRYNSLGRIHGFYQANKPQITVAEPEIIKNVLVKDFQYFVNRWILETSDPVQGSMLTLAQGEDWKRMRTIISPTFTTGKIKKLIRIFKECAKSVIQNFMIESTKSESVDVLRIFGAFTMDVIATSAFATKLDSYNNPENTFIKMAKRILNQGFSIKLLLYFTLPKRVKNYFKSLTTIFDIESQDFFKNITIEIIKERKKKGETRDDFLQLMMDAANEAGKEEKCEEHSDGIADNYGDASVNHSEFKGATTKHLSMDELVAQSIVLFLAGYHTTAATLGIATHFLALYQDEQERLFKEISEVLNITHGELTYESLQNMKHLDNVISESLRIHPPVVRLDRIAEIDYPLGDTGITVSKGMTIAIPICAMHRDPEFFPEPEKFIPDRFTPEEREKQIPYSYLPFGTGPRNCLGMRFALVEIKVCLIYVFSVFHVQLCQESKVPLEFGRGAGMLSSNPIYLKLTTRKDCPLKY